MRSERFELNSPSETNESNSPPLLDIRFIYTEAPTVTASENGASSTETPLEIDAQFTLNTPTSATDNCAGREDFRQSVLRERTALRPSERQWLMNLTPQQLLRVQDVLTTLGFERERFTPELIGSVCRTLTARLASENWEEREETANILQSLGAAAAPWLISARATSTDADVRRTCDSLFNMLISHRHPIHQLDRMVGEYERVMMNPQLDLETLLPLGRRIASMQFNPMNPIQSEGDRAISTLLTTMQNEAKANLRAAGSGAQGAINALTELQQRIEGRPAETQAATRRIRENLPNVCLQHSELLLLSSTARALRPDQLAEAEACLARAFDLAPNCARTRPGTIAMERVAVARALRREQPNLSLERIFIRLGGDIRTVREGVRFALANEHTMTEFPP